MDNLTKYTWWALSAFILGCALYAGNAKAEEDKPISCEKIAEVAESIMTGRQKGVSMPKMIEAANGVKLFESMVVEAYEEPRYSTPKIKQKVVDRMRDRWYLACFKSRSQ